MTDPRTYDDDEVKEIFSLAAHTQGAAPTTQARSGLTLRELQEVGREAGLAPGRVADAAALVDARGESLPRRTFLGGPTHVHRAVELPRELTDREWEALAGELREAFGASGRVTSRGVTHEWTGGDVHAFLEPTGIGHRLRLEARKSPLTVGTAAGAFGVFAGLLSLVTNALDAATPGFVVEVLLPLLLVLVGAGAVGLNVMQLRRWAGDRERLMEHIVERARALTEYPLPKNLPESAP